MQMHAGVFKRARGILRKVSTCMRFETQHCSVCKREVWRAGRGKGPMGIGDYVNF